MNRRRGRLVAFSAMGVCGALLVAGGLLSKKHLLEEWYLLRLESSDEAARLVAAERLGEMQSVRAVLPLMRRIQEGSKEEAAIAHGGFTSLSLGTAWSDFASIEVSIELTPLAYALYQIGPRALPFIEKALAPEDLSALIRIGNQRSVSYEPFVAILLAIQEALRNPSTQVGRRAYGSPESPFVEDFLPPGLSEYR